MQIGEEGCCIPPPEWPQDQAPGLNDQHALYSFKGGLMMCTGKAAMPAQGEKDHDSQQCDHPGSRRQQH